MDTSHTCAEHCMIYYVGILEYCIGGADELTKSIRLLLY